MDDDSLVETVFAPGNKLLLEYADKKKLVRKYNTVVEDLEGSYLVLQAPLEDGNPVTFRESQELTLRRVDDEKNEVYVTNVFVIDVRQGRIPLLVCSKPKKINKTSLRRFSRFNVNLPVKYCFKKEDKLYAARLNDLSLTGCYIVTETNTDLDEGAMIELIISIPGEAEVKIESKVIRIDESETEGNDIGIAIDYHHLDNVNREVLYSYIFQLQLTGDTILGGGIDPE